MRIYLIFHAAVMMNSRMKPWTQDIPWNKNWEGRGTANLVAVEPLQLITRRRFIIVCAIEQVAVPRVPGLPQEVFLVALFPKAGLP